MKESHNAKLCRAIANGGSNPFHTIEAIMEHCGSLWMWYRRQGYVGGEIEDGKRNITGGVGDFDFELGVIERYTQKVLNECAALMPYLYEASDGNMAALEQMKPHLEALAKMHQAEYDEATRPMSEYWTK